MATSVEAGITLEELQLAARNHALPLEALRYPITPVGLHYLLVHFDIPQVDPRSWRLEVGGRVARPLTLSLSELQARPERTLAVTLECAGNGRALLSPRALSQPWLREAVGTAEWTGTPLAPLLGEAGIEPGAVEVVFTGLDRGVQGDVEHDYERSLPLADALREEVLLAWAINGQPLPPQHGFPLRLVVPGWYGMTHVKWLRAITIVDEPFRGWQQDVAYHVRASEDEQGRPVTRMLPRSLMVPPGIPDFLSRTRFVRPGRCTLEGRAWSGWGPIERVEVSLDGGARWAKAELGDAPSAFAWRGWAFAWDAEPGEYELACRAADAAGNTQPLEPQWNYDGFCNNAVQRVTVVVGGTARGKPVSPVGPLLPPGARTPDWLRRGDPGSALGTARLRSNQ
ncbi:MAG: sulfite oxidase [Thermoleophilia bacterium]|nr:sulfite oxidase [Thermoleophilia bacterium]